MPIVTVTMIEGYPEETRDALAEALTCAVRTAIDAPLDGITVVLNEVPGANYRRGGLRRRPGPARPKPVDVVRAFLDAMAARDLEAARRLTADGFRMCFPGGARFTELEDLVDFARSRYRTVAKAYERFDVVPGLDETVVYCSGVLSGTWPDGSAFDGVRFVDRFTVRDGLLTTQEVWNDLAERKAADE